MEGACCEVIDSCLEFIASCLKRTANLGALSQSSQGHFPPSWGQYVSLRAAADLPAVIIEGSNYKRILCIIRSRLGEFDKSSCSCLYIWLWYWNRLWLWYWLWYR
jgi:hypothetical protein